MEILKITKNFIFLDNGSVKNTKLRNRKAWRYSKNKINNRNKYIQSTPVTKNLRKQIFERDNYSCQICGQKEHIAIHHGDCNRLNNDYWNLLTVCPCCHRYIHKGYF